MPGGTLQLIRCRPHEYIRRVEKRRSISDPRLSPAGPAAGELPGSFSQSETPTGWEEPDCLLCGGPRHELVVRAPDNAAPRDRQLYSVVRCQDCGLCFTSPRPSFASIGKFYPDWYEPFGRPLRRRLPWRSQLATRFGWPLEARRALPWHGQGRLLDFGCGGGSFLDRMHRLGWHVTGLDVSTVAVERIRRELGLPALAGSLPHPDLAVGSFDVITMWHSLEHLHDPLPALREAHRLLTAGGQLLVAVPNIDSLPFRWFGPAWYGLDLPRHLTHFSPATLRAMLKRAGFRIRRVRLLRHSHWLRESAKLACQQTDSSRWQRCLSGKITSRLVTSLCFLARRTDCLLVTAGR